MLINVDSLMLIINSWYGLAMSFKEAYKITTSNRIIQIIVKCLIRLKKGLLQYL